MYFKQFYLLFTIILKLLITTSAQYGYSHYDDIASSSSDIITIGKQNYLNIHIYIDTNKKYPLSVSV